MSCFTFLGSLEEFFENAMFVSVCSMAQSLIGDRNRTMSVVYFIQRLSQFEKRRVPNDSETENCNQLD